MMAVIMAVSMVFAFYSVEANAQSIKETLKERKALAKSTKSELNARAGRMARQEARRLEKEGWTIAPGQMPLKKQLDRLYMMQYEYDDTLYPKYIFGEAQSIGGNYDAARFQAMELAKIDIAGQIQSEIVGLVETNIGNAQLDTEEAASLTETVAGLKDIIAQKVGRTLVVLECYRTLRNKNQEVRLMVAYDSRTILQQTKASIKEELKEKSVELQSRLDQILGF